MGNAERASAKNNESIEEILQNTDVIIFATTFILRDFNHFIEDWKKNLQFSPGNEMRHGGSKNNKRAGEINFFLTKFRETKKLEKKSKKTSDNWQKPKLAPTCLVTCEEFNNILETAELISSGIQCDNYDNNRVHTKQLKNWEFWYE